MKIRSRPQKPPEAEWPFEYIDAEEEIIAPPSPNWPFPIKVDQLTDEEKAEFEDVLRRTVDGVDVNYFETEACSFITLGSLRPNEFDGRIEIYDGRGWIPFQDKR